MSSSRYPLEMLYYSVLLCIMRVRVAAQNNILDKFGVHISSNFTKLWVRKKIGVVPQCCTFPYNFESENTPNPTIQNLVTNSTHFHGTEILGML